jgi:hypothetical protein|tara:strand:+ start:1032 stop:1322 length:291 start_codon:yes stop_codon:yes gene_type:complete
MGIEIDKDTRIALGMKDFISLGLVLSTFIGMYFTLKTEIAEAKELPLPQEQTINSELIDAAIMSTRQDVLVLKEDIQEIKSTLEKLDDRIYKLSND